MPAQGGSLPHHDTVVDAIEALSPRQREVIEGLFYERLSERQLAKRMGLSNYAFWSHKHRAYQRLRRVLEDDRS